MNKLIKELADQASDTSDYGLECVTDKFLEHFAELIVRRCADVADQNGGFWRGCGTSVKQHFGVEE